MLSVAEYKCCFISNLASLVSTKNTKREQTDRNLKNNKKKTKKQNSSQNLSHEVCHVHICALITYPLFYYKLFAQNKLIAQGISGPNS